MNLPMPPREALLADLRDWVAAIVTPDPRLGGHAPCPFAHLGDRVSIVEVADGAIPPPEAAFDVVIYVLTASLDEAALADRCTALNARHPELVFLPDPRDRSTTIGGVPTGNGKHNLILCQPKAKLHAARRRLAQTDYYRYWDADYLREILGEDYAEIAGQASAVRDAPPRSPRS